MAWNPPSTSSQSESWAGDEGPRSDSESDSGIRRQPMRFLRPFGQKSCRTTVVSKEAAEPLPADNLRTSGFLQTFSWEQKHISFPLMRPFGVKMLHELCKCALQ
jgi:hypothetical protein